jgi:radical SAM protein with 4Fe4S-binding SPASM domain
VRGVDGFAQAARALQLLTQNGISVGVNCVVCRANFDHLEELVRFVRACGIRDVIFLRLKPGGRARPLYEILRLTVDQRREFYLKLKELTHRYSLHSHVDCAMMPFIYWHHPDAKALRLFAGEGCVGGNEIVEILPDGQVRACSFASKMVGRVWQLPQHWRTSPSLKAYRTWPEDAPEPCQSCGYLELCRGGCRAVAVALTGDFKSGDPECLFAL